jgi:hypothetical protein
MNAPEKISAMHACHAEVGGQTNPPLPSPPTFDNVADERLHRKQRLAATFRLFSKFGFDEEQWTKLLGKSLKILKRLRIR